MPIKGRYRKKTFRKKGGKPNIRQRTIKIGGGQWKESQYKKFYEKLKKLPKNVNIPPTVQKFIDNVEKAKNKDEKQKVFKKYSKEMPKFNDTIRSIRTGSSKEIKEIINEVFVKEESKKEESKKEESKRPRSDSISTIMSDVLLSEDEAAKKIQRAQKSRKKKKKPKNQQESPISTDEPTTTASSSTAPTTALPEDGSSSCAMCTITHRHCIVFS